MVLSMNDYIRYYCDKDSGIFEKKLFNSPIFWLICAFGFFVLSLLAIVFGWLQDFKSLGLSLPTWGLLVSTLAILAILGRGLYFAKNYLGDIKNLLSSLWFGYVADEISQGLLNASNNNSSKNAKYIDIPRVWVFKQNAIVNIIIAKIPGYYSDDIDKLREDVSSALKNNFVNFAITTAIVDDAQNFYHFICKDVKVKQVFTPENINDLMLAPYEIKLQNDLKFSLSKLPHIAVWGKSGAGKSTVLWTIVAECFSYGADVYFIDGKNEFSALEGFYPNKKIAVDSQKVLSILRFLVKKISQNQQKVKKGIIARQSIGLTAFDLDLKPIVVIADEIASVQGSMTSKEKKEFISLMAQIAQKGRSVGVFLVVASQSPAVDVLPQGIRSQFATKILLGSASSDVQRMAFGQVATNGDVEKYSGFYLQDGFSTPQRFWVPNLFENNLMQLEYFRQLYKRGLELDKIKNIA